MGPHTQVGRTFAGAAAVNSSRAKCMTLPVGGGGPGGGEPLTGTGWIYDKVKPAGESAVVTE